VTTFLLVHGGQHGSWCWQRVIPELERLGHSASAVDLPGNGCASDHTPLSEVTLSSYVQRVEDALLELSEPPVLVGHSIGY